MNDDSLTVFESRADLDRFWAWVSLAHRDWDAFAAELRTLDRATTIRFIWTFEDFAGEVFEAIEDSDFEHFEDAVSDDALEDICGWVVAQGEAFYHRCLDDPSLAPEDPEGLGIEVKYEAVTSFHERFGESPPSY